MEKELEKIKMNIVKFKHTERQKIFFWSDLHLNHGKDFILGPRKFKTAQEAKEELITRWNSIVSYNDTIFILGDTVVGAGENSTQEFESFLQNVNFHSLYILGGNHTAGYKTLAYHNKRSFDFASFAIYLERTEGNRDLKKVFLTPNYYEIVVNNQFIVLCHYPIYSWNEMGRGSWHLCGHTHGALNNFHKDRKSLDVGVENFPYPISFDEVATLMKDKPIFKEGHH